MSTMMTFEYLSQLCQNKEQVFSLPTEAKDLKGEETQDYETVCSKNPWSKKKQLSSTVASQIRFRLELYLRQISMKF